MGLEQSFASVYPEDDQESLAPFEHPYYEGGGILTQHDKEVMRRGLERLNRYLFECSPEELPTTVVFVDTSARPLIYLTRPIIQSIYVDKGVVEPHYRFLKTPHRYSVDTSPRSSLSLEELAVKRADLLDFSEIDALEMSEEMKEGLKELRHSMVEALEISKNRSQEEIMTEAMAKEQVSFQQRIQEIVSEKANDTVNKKLLIIDDYARPERSTIRSIREAVAAIDHTVAVNAFVFLSRVEGDDPEDVIVGSIDLKKQGEDSKGFDYREEGPWGTLRDEVTGINSRSSSENPYSELSVERNAESEKEFREALQELGREFINTDRL